MYKKVNIREITHRGFYETDMLISIKMGKHNMLKIKNIR